MSEERLNIVQDISIQKKDPEIHLPAMIFLTSTGLEFFRKNTKILLKRANNINGFAKEGYFSKGFHAQTMQKLIMNFYIEEIYSFLPELLPLRSEIISTNNLIVYSILYRKLTPSLAKALFESKVVKEFNRKHPKYSIVDLSHISPATVKLVFENQKYVNTINEIKKTLREKITERVLRNQYLNEEDKIAKTKALPKFIEWIDQRVWCLFLVIYLTEFKDQFLSTFENEIYNYLDHTAIATHLSNLIMEFVQNAEKAHFQILANRYLGIPKDQLDTFIRERKNRIELKKIAIEKKQNLEISWNLNPEKLAASSLSRIQILISNYGLIDENTAQKLRRKMGTNVDGISIASFYDDANPEGEKLGAGLGLLYNSYLEEICKKERIQYKCVIYPEPKKQKTTVKIDITL